MRLFYYPFRPTVKTFFSEADDLLTSLHFVDTIFISHFDSIFSGGSMYNDKMTKLGESRSVIRELFEYGNTLAKKIGRENVFDYTLGNPSIPTPRAVDDAIKHRIATTPTVHAYTSAQGLLEVREKIANFNRKTYGLSLSTDHIYMTCGAAASLSIVLRALICEEQDEIILLAPYFPEYKVFVENAGGKAVVVKANKQDFQIDLSALKNAITGKTAGIIVNSPNNPSGMVYSKETLQQLAYVLKDAEEEFSHPIILISDEPYREIVFDAPYQSPLAYYDDSALCYSYSKSFSLPGERIGYIALNDKLAHVDKFYNAIMGAGRSLGYVCAPSLFQQVIADCIDVPANATAYKEHRDLLISKLTPLGFEIVKPQGAFYMLIKAPNGDATAFAEMAKKHSLLLVPTDTFGLEGYVRLATCVSTDMILRSLPAFETLAKECFRK